MINYVCVAVHVEGERVRCARIFLCPFASNELRVSLVPTYRNTISIVFISCSSFQPWNAMPRRKYETNENAFECSAKPFIVIYFGECNQFLFGDSRHPQCVKYVKSLRVYKCQSRHTTVNHSWKYFNLRALIGYGIAGGNWVDSMYKVMRVYDGDQFLSSPFHCELLWNTWRYCSLVCGG